MDIVKQFLKKYNTKDDRLKNYNKGIINELVKILNGNIQEIYDNSDNDILLNYTGLYYEHELKI